MSIAIIACLFLGALITSSRCDELHLFHSLEDALVKDSKSLYSLQQALFSKFNHVSIKITSCITVSIVGKKNYGKEEDECKRARVANSSCNYSKCLDFQWTSSAVLDSISLEELVTLDNVAIANLLWYIESGYHNKANISLFLEEVGHQPSELELSQTLAKVLSWVSALYYIITQCSDLHPKSEIISVLLQSF